IRASLIAPNVLLFRSVAIDTPTGVRRKIFRITNVRANAGALGTAPGLNVTAMVRVDDVPVSDPVQVVAWINKGLSYQVRNPDSSEMLDDKQPCLSQSTECSGRRIATLRFVENFANAFKPRTAAIRGDRFASFSNTEDYWVGISESGQCNKVWSDDH